MGAEFTVKAESSQGFAPQAPLLPSQAPAGVPSFCKLVSRFFWGGGWNGGHAAMILGTNEVAAVDARIWVPGEEAAPTGAGAREGSGGHRVGGEKKRGRFGSGWGRGAEGGTRGRAGSRFVDTRAGGWGLGARARGPSGRVPGSGPSGAPGAEAAVRPASLGAGRGPAARGSPPARAGWLASCWGARGAAPAARPHCDVAGPPLLLLLRRFRLLPVRLSAGSTRVSPGPGGALRGGRAGCAEPLQVCAGEPGSGGSHPAPHHHPAPGAPLYPPRARTRSPGSAWHNGVREGVSIVTAAAASLGARASRGVRCACAPSPLPRTPADRWGSVESARGAVATLPRIVAATVAQQ